MRLNIGNLTIRNLIISYILLYTIMPIVSRLTSSYLTTYFYMAVVVVLVVLILALDRPENLNLYGSFLMPFVIYGILTVFLTREDIIMWGYQTLLFWLPVILGYYFTQDTARILPSYSKLIILAVVVTMITTIIGCIQNPNASRELATASLSAEKVRDYENSNIGGFHFVYIVVLLYPLVILSYKLKRIRLILALIISVIVLVTIIYTEYTTALLLFIITSLLYFTKQNLSFRGIIVLSVLAILFVFVFSSLIQNFLVLLGDTIDSQAISERLNALSKGVTGLEQSEDTRLYLYQVSIIRFFENPLFGQLFNGYVVRTGGHSFVLDTLATYGLLGGTLLVIIYKYIYKRFFEPYKEREGFGYVIWVFAQSLLLSIVNTGMWLDVLCLFVPIILFWIYKNKEDCISTTEAVESNSVSNETKD